MMEGNSVQSDTVRELRVGMKFVVAAVPGMALVSGYVRKGSGRADRVATLLARADHA